MSAEYSVEEALTMIDRIAIAYGSQELEDARAVLAERIKAGEGAVPVACEVVGIVRENDDGKYIDWTVEGSLDALEAGDALYCIDGIEAPDDGFTELFANPPAQAAHVEDDDDGLPIGFADWYNRTFAGQHVDCTRMDQCERAWRYALASQPSEPTAEPVAQGEADELIDAYDDAVRQQRESGFLPPLAQQAARDCVSHNRSRLRKALAAQPRAVPEGIRERLIRLQVGGCSCGTKTPELKYHDEGCHYRMAAEIQEMLYTTPSPGESA